MKKLFLFALTALACGATSMAADLVTEQPAGTHKKFYGYSMSTYPSYVPVTEASDGLEREVVFSEDGKEVWFKDPLTRAAAGTWIKGALKDGVITVETPQLVDRTEKDGKVADWYVQRLKKVTIPTAEGDATDWVPDTEKTTITYRFTGDSIVQVREEDVMLGMTNEGKYMFYGERDAVYVLQADKTVKFPAGSKPGRWSFLYNNDAYAHQAEAVVDGDDFYLKGFWLDFPEACIKGVISGDKIVFPSGQYLGRLTGANTPRYIYFTSSRKNPDAFGGNAVITMDQDMEFSYDRDARTVTPLFDDTLIPVVRNGKMPEVADYSPRAVLKGMRMKAIDSIKDLPDIGITKGGAFVYEDTGWGQVEFTFRALDSEKNALNPKQMSYSIWLDDEILVLDKEDAKNPEAYAGIDEPITEIPYLFDNGYGITSKGSAAKRAVMFYKLGFTEVGVQGFYYDDMTGRRIATNITYINPETQEIRVADAPENGVEEMEAGWADAVETLRYDLNGNRVAAGFKGIVVEQTRYSDGTVKTVKRMMK